ncbi:MAG: restriction endonuclease subunit S [Burkholderiales bacterium]
MKEASAKYFARPRYKQTELGVLPEEWALANLGTLSAFITKGSTPTTYGFGWQQDGILFLRSECVSENGLDLSQSMFISEAAHASLRRSEINDGDLLITITGNVGRIVIFKNSARANINQHIARVRIVAPEVDRDFVYHFLSLPQYRTRFTSITTGQAYPQISLKQVREAPIPLPPTKAEQEAIAEALSDADAFVESLEQLLAKKRRLKQGAMQELLTGKKRLPGFSGEWEVKPFSEVAQLRKERIDPQRTGFKEFCIELEHIEQGTGCLAGYTATSEGSSLKSVFHEGDILFGKLRAYLRKYWLASREGVCSTEIWVLIAKQSLLIPQFLFQLVKVDRFIEIASSAYGTHMPRSDWNVVKNYEVQLPPVCEQTAIASVLSDMDADIAALETRLAKAREIKQGMMQELLTGRIRLV